MIFTFFLVPLLSVPVALSLAPTSSKRGLIDISTPNQEKDASFFTAASNDLTWYYNYGAAPSPIYASISKLQFVPQLWGLPSSSGSSQNTNSNSNNNNGGSFLKTVRDLMSSGTKISYVLGFNEPDGPASTGGSNISPTDAATAWQKEIEPLKNDGVKLGAPAVTGAPGGFVWLKDFFDACNGNCTVDFIPVHWYGNFEGLASHIGQVRGTYPNKTIWITEYAAAHEKLQPTQQFYNTSAEYFDRLDYVTHYSYFGAFRSSVSNVGPNAAMLTEKGKLTDIGAWYLGQPAEGNVPKSGQTKAVSVWMGWIVVGLAVVGVANCDVW